MSVQASPSASKAADLPQGKIAEVARTCDATEAATAGKQAAKPGVGDGNHGRSGQDSPSASDAAATKPGVNGSAVGKATSAAAPTADPQAGRKDGKAGQAIKAEDADAASKLSGDKATAVSQAAAAEQPAALGKATAEPAANAHQTAAPQHAVQPMNAHAGAGQEADMGPGAAATPHVVGSAAGTQGAATSPAAAVPLAAGTPAAAKASFTANAKPASPPAVEQRVSSTGASSTPGAASQSQHGATNDVMPSPNSGKVQEMMKLLSTPSMQRRSSMDRPSAKVSDSGAPTPLQGTPATPLLQHSQSRRTTGSIPLVPLVVTAHDKQNTVNASQLLKLGAFKLQPLVDFVEYSELIKLRLEDGIDPTRREDYLSDENFATVFGMDREAFKALPAWKKQQKKKQVNLF